MAGASEARGLNPLSVAESNWVSENVEANRILKRSKSLSKRVKTDWR